ADVRALLLEAATARRSPGLPAMLRDAVDDPAAAVRVAAWRGLAEFATAAAYADAVQRLLLRPEADQAVRQAHENALVRMAARLSAQEEDGAGSVAPLAALWQGDAPVSVRVAVLRLAGRLGGDSALGLVRQGLAAADADLRREALRALAAWPDDGAVEDLLALLAGKEDAAAHTLAARGLARQVEQDLPAPEEQLRVLDALAALAEDASLGAWARRRREAVVSGSTAELALVAVPRRSARRRQELAEGVPEGFRLVAYLDCGPEAVDGKAPAPCLRVVRGAPYLWAGAEKNGPVQAATVIFDGSLVSVEASGLDPGKTYRVGMTWWDYDAHGRVQTVVAGGTALLSRVRLPNHARDRQPAAEAMVELPAGVYGKGVVRVDVLRAGPVNAVLSEVWLLESDAPPERAAGTAPFPGAKRVLLLTGEDYKGHAWQATAPVLAAELRQDRRFVVDVVDDLTRLRTLALDDYAAVVLHFKNYDAAVPGREAFDRLAAFVRAGGGLVLVHFAGGAFEEFRADFAPLAGRVWNPALRGHDPYGAFRVRIAPVAHPITAGLADFETTDELYTCLEGDLPVTVLADAVSRVDGKDYPMAFVFPCGQGRVFHCPLGHDPGALAHPTVAELFRRGTAWCAGLDPVASAPPARTSSGADVLRRVLFVAGPDSHGEGTHDHEAGCRLLAAELERCVAGMAADVSLGWPQDGRLLAGADALVVYSDGEEGHPILGHIEDVAARVKQGMGVVCLHYALAVPGETAGAAFLEWLGGYYETWWSVNPVWEAHFEALPEHLVTRGVRPFALRDEWYYHMRFREGMEGVVPVLSAVPPDATRRGPDGPHSGNPQVRARMGRAEHVAWAYEGRDGARGFGFTGGHWHANWQHPDVLRLVLNAIVWAARGEVPPGGTGGESAAQPPSR
ncbi:MAG: ThuA domain-containing protein, partial [Lentisphaeria bacterium]|nr:ThuA domain-containing protein [Lentisphaeria bacterium]